MVKHYGLSSAEETELSDIIEKSKKSLKIDMVAADSLHKTVALQFQRSFQDMDDETMKKIQELLERRAKK
jgi:RecA/RadA recombinase